VEHSVGVLVSVRIVPETVVTETTDETAVFVAVQTLDCVSVGEFEDTVTVCGTGLGE